uniref:PH domain-containing protein n=1 Tax=Glossina pallidipes TaxID=7398 RepID=A0A1B0AEN1_GLOPL
MNRSAHGSIKSAATVRLSKSFQSKMDKMSERLYDIVKSGFMIKRAQNKKRFTPVNYKQRWFELTKRTLSYFDVESVESRFCETSCRHVVNPGKFAERTREQKGQKRNLPYIVLRSCDVVSFKYAQPIDTLHVELVKKEAFLYTLAMNSLINNMKNI